jgi:4-amino-4-deoxy-L-arabinose transferase-like glycosyltransferase
MAHDPGSLQGAAPRQSSQSIVERFGAALLQPHRVVLLLAGLQLLLWGPLAALYDAAPPTDSLEQILFSQDLRLFYVKHPALPTWLLWLVNQWRGPSIETTFILGALCASATLALLYAWTRPLIGARRAAVVTLLTSTIVFLNVGAIQYNNNTVQLPLAMLSIVLFHRAVAGGRARDWALLGAAAALFTLAKFSAVVLFASFAVYLHWTGRLRERTTWKAIGVAALAFAALMAPSLIAARAADADSNHYAWIMMFPPEFDRLQRLASVWHFTASQLAAVAPAVLLFVLLRRGSAPAAPAHDNVPFTSFVTIVGFGPMVLTVVIAVLAGARLLSGWGTTFHLLVPLWLVVASGFAITASRKTLMRAFVGCLAVQSLLWVAMIGNHGSLPSFYLYRKGGGQGPLAPAALADVVQQQWNAASSDPLRFVVADIRTGAPLAVVFHGSPRVIDGNRPDFAHEFPAETQAACGYVAVTSRPPVIDPRAPGFDPLHSAFTSARPTTPVAIRAPDGSALVYYVAVRPPSNRAGCAAGAEPLPRPDDFVD